MTNVTKDDRVLLELAAKAAGVKGHFIESFPEDGAPAYSCGIGNAGRITPPWNPLANDGDALRLAVKLAERKGGAALMLSSRLDSIGFATVYTDEQHISSQEYMLDDPLVATRRAIVRAAAEIGKAMLA